MTPAVWLSLRELTKRRAGTAIAVGVIALAVAFAAGLELVARAREAAIAADLDQIGPAIRIIPRGKTARHFARFELEAAPFRGMDIRRLRSEYRSAVSSIEGRLSLQVPFDGQRLPVIGVIPRTAIAPFDVFQQLQKYQVLVGAELASRLKITQGATIELQSTAFEVLAILPSMASQDDSAVFLHLEHLQRMFSIRDAYNELRVFPAPGTDVDALAASIAARHADMTPLKTQRGEDAEHSMLATLRDHRRVLYLVTGVVVAASVLTWSYMNGIERRLELATLVAVGGSAWIVVSMILTRGALLGAFGATAGFLLGAALSLGQDAGATLRILPSLDLATMTIVTTTILSAIGALPAAGLAAVQDPVRVLQDA